MAEKYPDIFFTWSCAFLGDFVEAGRVLCLDEAYKDYKDPLPAVMLGNTTYDGCGLPVFEYMLKPVVRSEVTETLLHVKKRLDEMTPSTREPAVEIEASAIEQLKEYLRKNYTNTQINLTSVAQMFCTATEVGIPDPNYFGRCFKKYTGKSYSEYARSRAK